MLLEQLAAEVEQVGISHMDLQLSATARTCCLDLSQPT